MPVDFFPQRFQMISFYPADLPQFAKQFKFAGGRIRAMKLLNGNGDDPTLELLLSIRSISKSLSDRVERVRLRLRFVGVEEFRFQKRPGTPSGRISECKFGYFQNLFYVNFDAWGLPPGEMPKVHDFRASDTYVGCRDLKWERIELPPPKSR